MGRFIAVRTALVLPTALAASLIVFGVMRILPGDVALTILSGTQHTEEMREALREELGLNDPLPVQYGRWLAGFVTGRLGGVSLETREPIRAVVARRLPVTLALAVYTLVLSFVTAIPLGIAAALHRGRPIDTLIRAVSLGGLSLPNVWLGLILLLLLLLLFRWSPPIIYIGLFESPGEHLALMVWPALLLSWEYGSHIVRMTRASMIEVLGSDYIVNARARGVGRRSIVFRHALRGVLVPVLTVAGMQFGSLLGGTLVLETIFGIPGIGRGLVLAALARDYPVVQTIVTLLVLGYLAVNLLIDCSYLIIDHRIGSRMNADG